MFVASGRAAGKPPCCQLCQAPHAVPAWVAPSSRRPAAPAPLPAPPLPLHLPPRFYRLSSELVRAVMAGLDDGAIDFSFRVSPAEQEVIEMVPDPPRAVILLGRSGTGARSGWGGGWGTVGGQGWWAGLWGARCVNGFSAAALLSCLLPHPAPASRQDHLLRVPHVEPLADVVAAEPGARPGWGAGGWRCLRRRCHRCTQPAAAQHRSASLLTQPPPVCWPGLPRRSSTASLSRHPPRCRTRYVCAQCGCAWAGRPAHPRAHTCSTQAKLRSLPGLPALAPGRQVLLKAAQRGGA